MPLTVYICIHIHTYACYNPIMYMYHVSRLSSFMEGNLIAETLSCLCFDLSDIKGSCLCCMVPRSVAKWHAKCHNGSSAWASRSHRSGRDIICNSGRPERGCRGWKWHNPLLLRSPWSLSGTQPQEVLALAGPAASARRTAVSKCSERSQEAGGCLD